MKEKQPKQDEIPGQARNDEKIEPKSSSRYCLNEKNQFP